MEVLRTAILQVIRQKKNKTFFAEEPLQQMYPEDWERFLDELQVEFKLMEKEGLLDILEQPSSNGNHPIVGKKIAPKKPQI
ncbi:hypothetical protein SAMN04489724_1005 [Algoriphagus locisalis]|uniref:Uncharacterized protein n=1 Tax=Algoriphagus locisalis TaxID=305507 RepID=A0A1I6YH87_9BACT|nr:hypothetical protein [Algoriphagus locisalis]SFT49760.1 hypothetical protein SAMN04489724_1005 [Algoriphagus locisalis]